MDEPFDLTGIAANGTLEVLVGSEKVDAEVTEMYKIVMELTRGKVSEELERSMLNAFEEWSKFSSDSSKMRQRVEKMDDPGVHAAEHLAEMTAIQTNQRFYVLQMLTYAANAEKT